MPAISAFSLSAKWRGDIIRPQCCNGRGSGRFLANKSNAATRYCRYRRSGVRHDKMPRMHHCPSPCGSRRGRGVVRHATRLRACSRLGYLYLRGQKLVRGSRPANAVLSHRRPPAVDRVPAPVPDVSFPVRAVRDRPGGRCKMGQRFSFRSLDPVGGRDPSAAQRQLRLDRRCGFVLHPDIVRRAGSSSDGLERTPVPAPWPAGDALPGGLPRRPRLAGAGSFRHSHRPGLSHPVCRPGPHRHRGCRDCPAETQFIPAATP